MHDVPPKSISRDKAEAAQIDVNTAFEKFLRWERVATAGSAMRRKFYHTVAYGPNMGCKHVGWVGAFLLKYSYSDQWWWFAAPTASAWWQC